MLQHDYHETPIIVGTGNDIRIIKLASVYSDQSAPNKLMFYNRNGVFVKERPFNRTIGYLGLNTLDLNKTVNNSSKQWCCSV